MITCARCGAPFNSEMRCVGCGAVVETVPVGPLVASGMTPADHREERARRWMQGWCGVDVHKQSTLSPQSVPPLGDREGVLRAVQRAVDWWNAGGVSGSALAAFLAALLQRCGRPQRPPCCTCQGTGAARDDAGAERPCPEGCR